MSPATADLGLGLLAGAMRLERPGQHGHTGGQSGAQRGAPFRSSLSAILTPEGSPRHKGPAEAGNGTSPKLVEGDYTYVTSRKALQVTKRSLNVELNPAEGPLSLTIPAMRPTSATSVNMAAWKAYGSPSVRGVPRTPPPASLSAANTAPQLFGGVPSKPPRVQNLGGGFKFQRPSSAPVSRAPGHESAGQYGTPPSPKSPQRAPYGGGGGGGGGGRSPTGTPSGLSQPSGPGGSGWAGPRPYSAMPVLQRPQHLRGLQQHEQPATAAAPPVASSSPGGDLRWAATLPTDPYGKYMWEQQSRHARAGAERAAALARPASGRLGTSSGGVGALGGGSSTSHASAAGGRGSERFRTTRMSTLQQQQGPGRRPPTVTGFAAAEAGQELSLTLPGPDDPRWAFTRLGRTQITKLQQALKIPTPVRERLAEAPMLALGRNRGGGGSAGDSPGPRVQGGAGLALKRGPRLSSDDGVDDVAGGRGFGSSSSPAGCWPDPAGGGDEPCSSPATLTLGSGRRKQKAAGFLGADGGGGGSGCEGGVDGGDPPSQPASSSGQQPAGGAGRVMPSARASASKTGGRAAGTVDLRHYLGGEEEEDEGDDDGVGAAAEDGEEGLGAADCPPQPARDEGEWSERQDDDDEEGGRELPAGLQSISVPPEELAAALAATMVRGRQGGGRAAAARGEGRAHNDDDGDGGFAGDYGEAGEAEEGGEAEEAGQPDYMEEGEQPWEQQKQSHHHHHQLLEQQHGNRAGHDDQRHHAQRGAGEQQGDEGTAGAEAGDEDQRQQQQQQQQDWGEEASAGSTADLEDSLHVMADPAYSNHHAGGEARHGDDASASQQQPELQHQHQLQQACAVGGEGGGCGGEDEEGLGIAEDCGGDDDGGGDFGGTPSGSGFLAQLPTEPGRGHGRATGSSPASLSASLGRPASGRPTSARPASARPVSAVRSGSGRLEQQPSSGSRKGSGDGYAAAGMRVLYDIHERDGDGDGGEGEEHDGEGAGGREGDAAVQWD